jgi:hypothetical protein
LSVLITGYLWILDGKMHRSKSIIISLTRESGSRLIVGVSWFCPSQSKIETCFLGYYDDIVVNLNMVAKCYDKGWAGIRKSQGQQANRITAELSAQAVNH